MGIVVIGAVFVDVKGYPEANFIPTVICRYALPRLQMTSASKQAAP